MTKAEARELVIDFDERRGQFSTEIHRHHVERWEQPPLSIYEAALASKLETSDRRRFKFHFRYLDMLTKAWPCLRRDKSVPFVRLVLAQGCPDLSMATLDFDPRSDRVLQLTLPSASELRFWRSNWLEAYINHAITLHGIDGVAHPGQLRTLFSRAAYYGETVRAQSVAIRHRSDATGFSGAYNVVPDSKRLEVNLYVSDIRPLATPDGRRRLFAEVEDALWQLVRVPGASPVCRFLFSDLETAFERANVGPQRLGLQLPLILPAGFVLREEPQHPRLSDPSTLARLGGGKAPAEGGAAHAQTTMLLRRGLLQDGKLNPRLKVLPLVALEEAPSSTRHRYVALAARARGELDVDDRELQALTIPVAAQSVGAYVNSIDQFWRLLHAHRAEEPPAAARHDATVVAWSTWLPLSLPSNARKSRAEILGAKAHDRSAWLSLIVRECVALGGASTAEAIASCLVPEVSLGAVERALEALTANGLITYDRLERRYYQSSRNILTGDDLPSERLLQVHREFSQMMGDTLAARPEQCHSRALTFRVSKAAFQDLKQRLREWLLELLNKSAKESRPDQIFLLGAQMFLLGDEAVAIARLDNV